MKNDSEQRWFLILGQPGGEKSGLYFSDLKLNHEQKMLIFC